MNNPLITFLQEMFLRATTKSPLFFKIIQILTGAIVLVAYLPATLQAMGITVSPEIADFMNRTLAKIAAGGFIISMLTTKSNAVGVDEAGKVIKTTNEKRLPFTSAAEKKSADKHDVPTVEISKI